MITLLEYQEGARRTMPSSSDELQQLHRLVIGCEFENRDVSGTSNLLCHTHALMGMADERFEIDDAIYQHDTENLKEEIGDFFWYLSMACDSCDGIDFVYLASHALCFTRSTKENQRELGKGLGAYASSIKKAIFYGKEYDEEQKKERVDALITIYGALQSLCVNYRFSVQVVMLGNLEKLKARYPEKFTQTLAKERLDKQHHDEL